jgi:RimJ/RimL family protein N-acetyltransferase
VASRSARNKLAHSAPVLETARLRLRGFVAADLDPQLAMHGDSDVMRHFRDVPNREDTWRKMLAGVGLWAMLGYGHWAVERREDGRFLGHVGLFDFKRDIVPSLEGIPEMGWMLARHAHGQGYAAEAVGAALEWADHALAAPEIAAIIDPGNETSIRLAERLGFRQADKAIYDEERVLIFRRKALPAAAAASAAAST